ncbi:hypothetical protein [Apibacter mensalis]|uniref:hypothetical protein n=2 Tax=Apibacter TaxID=1778601 RepID=UPI0026F2C608|nr:hypothetical protein [Apibacter mensalis]
MYYYGARYYNPRESVWLSADPLSGYNPNNETEHYIDGQHNGGVYNSFNLNTNIYCYHNPVKLVDPNGKQAYFQGMFNQSDMNALSAQAQYQQSQVNNNSTAKATSSLSSTIRNTIFTNTETNVVERNILSNNILMSATMNTTTTVGNSGIFNSDIKVTNGKSTSYENQADIGILKSNVGFSKSDISASVGVSLLGTYDVSVGVKLTPDILNSEINIGISENINRDNTSTGLNIGIKPAGALILIGTARSGNLTPPPILQPAVN